MSDGTEKGQISDGYHTFDELYDHRNLLFINLCLSRSNTCWYKEDDAAYPGWFCLYMKTLHGQISYHIPNKYLPLVEGKLTGKQQSWDKHTKDDVLTILEKMCVKY